MDNIFLEQVAKTGDLNADLIMRQYKLNKMSKFMEIKSINPKLKQSDIARDIKLSSPTLQRYGKKCMCFHPIEYQHQTL